MKTIKTQNAWLLIGALSALLGGATLAGCGDGGGDEGEGTGAVRPGGDDDDDD